MSRYGQRTLVGTNREISSVGKKPPAGIGVVQGYGVATGGSSSSVTVSGTAYTLLTFTSDGTLTVTTAGLFDVLLFAGGGCGGRDGGGGGGAGGVLQSTIYLDANQSIVVGAGGAGSATNPNAGLASSIGTSARNLHVVGGGFGSGIQSSTSDYSPAIRGGSGGGGALSNAQTSLTGSISLAPSISGFAGGNGVLSTSGGGGGGATAVGTNGSGSVGGNGGAGYDVDAFTGAGSLFKAGGGGGTGSSGGTGGSGVGGNRNSSASANTASGGGGSASGAGGSGGSGIVYIRFKV